VSLPVLISPTGVQAVHPDGEAAVARAAAARRTVMGLSSFASKPVEEVVEASPQTFFQTYWVGTRQDMAAHVERARAAGAAGLILTLDWTWSNGRDWGSPVIPERVDLKTAIQFAPQVLRHPRWLLGYAKTGHLPDLTVPNMTGRGEPAPTLPQTTWSSRPDSPAPWGFPIRAPALPATTGYPSDDCDPGRSRRRRRRRR
jgi:isopentenyl diphosphate isomerase/L-lactate dehydrogenase-like FMN-dependent dehydrogenase